MKMTSIPKAFVVMNWIAACGLFVSCQLLLPKRGPLTADAFEEILFDRPRAERPERSFFTFMQTAKRNDDGLWQSPSKEDIQAVAEDWGQYALKLEANLDLAQSYVQSRRISAARIATLFWIAFGFVIINAFWSAAFVLKCDDGDKVSACRTRRAQPAHPAGE